ncbi:MAG: DNA adenine methylase, partial [Albidovulum sp.]
RHCLKETLHWIGQTGKACWCSPTPDLGEAHQCTMSPLSSALSMPVEPILPVAPWVGGKRNLARRIAALIDVDRHETYAEPFAGMGGVFLRRTRRPKAEVINDAPEVRDIFSRLNIQPVATTYTIGTRVRPAAEPLISSA